MPDLPYPITNKDPNEMIRQMTQVMQETYEERVGGAQIGDVMAVGADDVLSINVSATGGLQKLGGNLAIKCAPSGGLGTGSNGLGVLGPIAMSKDMEITDTSKGVILKAPNGTRYRITVSNAGALVIAPA